MFNHIETTSLTNQLCQLETLDAAWRKVRANKGGPGSDGVTIQQFESDLPKHLRQSEKHYSETDTTCIQERNTPNQTFWAIPNTTAKKHSCTTQ